MGYPYKNTDPWITWLAMIAIAGLVIGSVAYAAYTGSLFL